MRAGVFTVMRGISRALFVSLSLVAALPAAAHKNHITTTTVTCTPNPVVRGSSTTCTLRVDDVNPSQAAQPAGTLTLYRGSTAGANLGSCTAGGIPNQTASRCAVVYSPPTAGNETLVAQFVSVPEGTQTHHWTTSQGSTVLTVSPAPAAALRVVVAPSGQPANAIAGSPIPSAGGAGVRIEVLNTLGERITTGAGSTLSVTIAIQTNPGGSTLGGTKTVAAVAGVATFSTLTLDKAGVGYRLRATGTGVAAVNTGLFDVTAAAASRFAFAQQPALTVAGQVIGGGVGVTARVEDAFGNVVTTDDTTQISVSLAANPTGAALAGDTVVTAIDGVATFPDLVITTAGLGYTLQATGIYTTGVSSAFDIVSGPPAQVSFGDPPVNTTAGQVIGGATGVTVRIEDANGNLITGSGAPVTLALAANPGMTTLQAASLTVNAVNGVAAFPDLVITAAATGYTIAASSPGLVSETSAPFNITPSAAVQLAFGQPPTNNEADAAIAPAVTVRIEDANGNLVDDNREIVIAFDQNPGGAPLVGTLSVFAVNGVATFADLQITVAAAGYTLIAADSANVLTPAVSAPFTIAAGAPTKLTITEQPTDVAAGSLITPAVVVEVRDTFDNVVTGATDAVTLAIGANPGGAVLSGTQTVNAVNGVATFPTLSLNRAGSGYTLVASATSLAGDVSAPFDVSVGAPAVLKFSQQPSNTIAGQVISALVGGVAVRVEDSSGNLVTGAAHSVTLAIYFDAGGVGTVLGGTTTVAAAGGIATFPDLSIQNAGVGYTLQATAVGLTGVVSQPFNITHGAAASLAFGVQPADATAGAVITPSVQVRVLDAFGNLVADSTTSVILAIAANPGGGFLGGNGTANAVGGVASFPTLFINAAGAGYTLSAASGGLTGATSDPFDVNAGPAAKLGFLVQPTNTQLLATMTPAVQVAVQDSLGNTITTSNALVSLVLDSNPGGGELGGAVTVAASGGVATFASLSLDRTGNGYTIQANSSGLASTTSNSFDVLTGPPAQLVFVQQPFNTDADTVITPWPSVQAQDAAGNPVDFTGNITIAIGNNTSGGTLSGTLVVAAVGGVATFDDLGIDNEGTGYTLVASSGALTPGTSGAFNVMEPGFTFTGVEPVSGPTTGGTVVTITGSGFGTQGGRYQVIFGTANPAPPVTATRQSNSELTLDTPAHPPGLVNVIVVDTHTGGTRALQGVYTYIASAPAKLRFGNQPTDIVAGSTFSPPVTVEILDVNNNVVNNATHAVTIAFQSNLPGGTLLGTTTVNAVAGVATFTDLSVDKVGTGYTLTASASGLQDPLASNAFAVTAGDAAQLAFQQQPTNNDPGVPITPAITVEVQDAFGNLVTSSNASIDMAIGINAGAGTLSGGVTVAAINGVATFSSLSIDKAGDGYNLVATSDGLDQAESASFNIAFGQPTRVTVTTHPGNGVAGVALTPTIVVQVEDNLGNVVEDFTGEITIAIANNAGGSTLTGTLSAFAVDGVAAFANVVLDKVGAGYTLAAQGFGLESGITDPFDITNNVAAALVFDTQPTDVSQGSVVTPVLLVKVVDAFGNHVPDATDAITLAIGDNPGGGTLGGTTVRNAIGGIASFNDITVSAGGDGYTLVASSGSLDAAVTMPFNVISVGGTFNIFSSTTPAGDIIGYLPTVVAGEEFCVDVVKINEAGTAPADFTNITMTLQMLDASVNTGSLQAGNCRSSWTVIQEWRGIAAAPGDGSRITVCAGLQGLIGSETLNNLSEPDVWPNVRFRAFTTSGNAGVGCSNDAFAQRPDFFELASITVTDDDWQTAGQTRSLLLGGAATTSGGAVHAAGRPFRVQVTAINKQGQPTGNYNGKPTIEVLERLLPAQCIGCPAPEVTSTGWGPAAGVAGAVRTNQALFHDAGALRVRLIDETFSAVDQIDIDLGLMDPSIGVIVSQPLDIGRFVPDNFVVSPTSTPELRTQGVDPMMCGGDRSFTYVGQGFGYAVLPQATVSARSANGAVTPGYQGALWKLAPAKVLQEYTYNTSPADAATLDTSMAPAFAGNASLVSNGDGTGTLTVAAADRLAFEREPLLAPAPDFVVEDPPAPFDAFITLTMRVFDDAELGVTGNQQINTGTPGVFSNMAFDEGNEFRYGRLRLINAVGSELVPLEIPYRLQTWQDIGSGIFTWVTAPDNCSVFTEPDFSVLDIQATGVPGFAPVVATGGVINPPVAGEGGITLHAHGATDGSVVIPGATGSFTLEASGIPSYLQYNWDSDEAGAERDPTARGAFGVNEGHSKRIFRSQSFIPRGG